MEKLENGPAKLSLNHASTHKDDSDDEFAGMSSDEIEAFLNRRQSQAPQEVRKSIENLLPVTSSKETTRETNL